MSFAFAPDEIDAVLFDMGGVFTLPAPDVIRAALSPTGLAVPLDDRAFHRAHYDALAAHDRDCPAEADIGAHYLRAYLASLGFVGDDLDRADAAVTVVWHLPSDRRWTWRQDEAVAALGRIAATGRGVAVVSNCDGTAERILVAGEICQVGEGPGVPVTAIVDSHLVGVAKPDPAIFTPALDALEAAAHRAVFVGDSLRYDVAGARAAGLHPVHLDPYGLAGSNGVDRIAALAELAEYLA
jgi:putative hydrolase of the HAD superfamily